MLYANIVGIIAGLMLLALFGMFIWGGINYLTSFGEQEKLQKAQNTLKFAIIGFILYVSAFLILSIINYLFVDGTFSLLEFNIGN